MSSPAPGTACRYLVGIGASAGGLEALRTLFGAFKSPPAHMAFVVVQHLAPLHRSRLVELVASSTKLTVAEVSEGDTPRCGTVYITPPNANLLSEDGRLRLKATEAGPKPSVDTFFRSLSADWGNRAVGVILSGTGSDGAQGMRAIKAAGGLTLCQSPDSCKYDGMPRAAMQTGAVDHVVPPEHIAAELVALDPVKPAGNHAHKPARLPMKRSAASAYDDILRTLERQAGVSFSRYKQSTVRRRMERRMVATHCSSLMEYATHLEETPGEAQNLMQDILISVTSFFRDGEAFKALSQCVVERLKGKRDGGHFRCWVIGCASGEEAYSMAILLSEAMEKVRRNVHLQIFATDLDEQALAVARRGLYSRSSFAGISRRLLDKYFVSQDDGYQVKPSLRDLIVFARHNAAEDAPFLNLDLASCRNVLIYFNSQLQEHIFATLQYALPKGALLFLGKSEAVPAGNRWFSLVNKRFKIYSRAQVKGEIVRPATLREAHREAALISTARDAGHSLDLFNAVVAGLAPDSIIVDGDFYIKHVFGDAGHHLTHPPGRVTQDLSKLLPLDIGTELVTLVRRAGSHGRSVTGRRHELRRGKHKRRPTLQLSVVPIESNGQREYLVCFNGGEVESPSAARQRVLSKLSAEQRVEQLQKELAEAREHLQTVQQEQETANEELQSLNEELQSSNEELETTNEELQSANEELITVNEELNAKSGELQTLNARLQAIQNAIVYPLLIIDRNRRLANFNPAARQLLRLADADIGIDIKAIAAIADMREVVRILDEAFTRRAEPRVQLQVRERSFEVQVQGYRNAKGLLDGVVVSFVDNTDIMSALEESRLNRERLSSIMEGTPAIVTMKDLAGLYVYANKRFADLVGRPAETIVGHSDEELFGVDAATPLQERDYEVIRRKRAVEFVESFRIGKTQCIWHSSKFPLFDGRKRVQSVCTVSMDMTERLANEEQLQLFKRAIAASNTGVLLLEPAQGDEAFRTRFASDQVAPLTGLPHGRLIGVGLRDLLQQRMRIKQRPEQIEEMVERIQKEPESVFLVPVGRGISGENWLEIRASHAVANREGAPDTSSAGRHLTLTILDVTQRVRDQRTIAAQQEEMEKVGRFSALTEIAAGIAHEVNTPLSVIMTKTGILKTLARQDRMEALTATGVADDIARMAKSVSEIVHSLSTLVARNGDKLERSCIKRIVADAGKMCESRFHRFGVEMHMDLPDEDVPVECYPVQILQVIINLLNNAVDAVSDNRDRWVRVDLRADEEHAEVIVTDSGSGIDSAYAEKIFTPFFTTKNEREGTGIGLSLSRSIARRHNGELTLESGSANTSFRLLLPRKVGAPANGDGIALALPQ